MYGEPDLKALKGHQAIYGQNWPVASWRDNKISSFIQYTKLHLPLHAGEELYP